MKRVVITGQGTINALGQTISQTLDAMNTGQCGIAALEFKNNDRLAIKIGAQIKDYDEQQHFTRSEISFYDPFTQFALIAAKEAIAQSGLVFEGEFAQRCGVILGTAGGGLQTQDENYRAVYEEGKNRVHPFVVPRLMNNAAVSHVSMQYGLRGPCFTVSTACASSNHAMGQAFDMVRMGHAPVMITGGSESMLCFGGIKAWEGLRVLSNTGCRPFCETRDGMVQGEGAAVFVFEDYDHAVARGADILAEVAGVGMSSDANDIVAPSAQGAEAAMRNALHMSGLTPSDIGYINAHGTGTRINDQTECRAITNALGDEAKAIPVSSTKSMHGHVIGGTGAIELLACINALKTGVIAPTINHTVKDKDCDLNIVTNDAIEKDVKATLSNAFAFGGLNAVIALKAV